jgi:predicted PurR-regulated permease PerM
MSDSPSKAGDDHVQDAVERATGGEPDRPGVTDDRGIPLPEAGTADDGPSTEATSKAALASAHAPVSASAELVPDAARDRRVATRYGLPGMPVRGHPFQIGFVGGLGVLVAIGLVSLLDRVSYVLTLVAIAMFLAMALDPLVQFLVRRGLKRIQAVGVVVLLVILVFAGFIASVIPPLVEQAEALITGSPELLDQLRRSDLVARLDKEYGVIGKVQEQIRERLSSGDTVTELFGGVLGAGRAVISFFFSAFTVLVLTLYFLISLRNITEAGYRLVPASRRERVRLLGDEIIRRIGGYVAGQLTVASINGCVTFIVLTVLGMPYALVLAITVALCAIIPLIGGTLGGTIVVLVALGQSWKTALAIAVYILIYQQIENYLISPRVMSRTVSVPGAVALVAALAGGTLLGLLGALIAIPLAAGILLIMREVVIPRQDRA